MRYTLMFSCLGFDHETTQALEEYMCREDGMFCGEHTPGYGSISSCFKTGAKLPVRTLGNRHDVVQPDRSDLEPFKSAEVAGARNRLLGLPAVENHHFCLFHRRQLWGSARTRCSLCSGSSNGLSLETLR